MTGHRTSIYLTDELSEAVRESGMSLAELLWLGLTEDLDKADVIARLARIEAMVTKLAGGTP